MQLMKELGSFNIREDHEEPDVQSIYKKSEPSTISIRNSKTWQNHQREPLMYIGPVSMSPNMTSIKRLDQKGILQAETKGFSLPVLSLKESKNNIRREKMHKNLRS